MERWSDGEREYQDLGRRGMQVSYPIGAEVVCRRCHRMISNMVHGGRQEVHCCRTVDGVLKGIERIPSYCPLGYLGSIGKGRKGAEGNE